MDRDGGRTGQLFDANQPQLLATAISLLVGYCYSACALLDQGFDSKGDRSLTDDQCN